MTKEQQENIKAVEDASEVENDQLRNAPRWLTDKAAQAEWKRLVKELKKAGLICNLDRNNVGMYCNCWSDYLRVSKLIKTLLPKDEKELLPEDEEGLRIQNAVLRERAAELEARAEQLKRALEALG